MAKAKTLEDILRQGGKPLEDKKRGATTWFFRTVRQIRDVTAKPGDAKGRTGYVTKGKDGLPGQMIMFSYDPKHKDTLPYYDRYPVVIPLTVDATSMLGLNLHYLPPQVRLAFVRALQQLAEETNGIKRMRITYGILKSAKGLGSYAPCIKRYLHGHVKSKITQIDDREWEHAALLPVARWVGATESEVWSDSMSGRRPKRKSAQRAAAKKSKAKKAKARTAKTTNSA